MKLLQAKPFHATRGHRPLFPSPRISKVPAPSRYFDFGVESDPPQGLVPLFELEWLDLVPCRKSLSRLNRIWSGLARQCDEVAQWHAQQTVRLLPDSPEAGLSEMAIDHARIARRLWNACVLLRDHSNSLPEEAQ